MPVDLTADDRAALVSVVGRLEAAWNAMDGAAFAAPFASDADFVTIRGEHFRGRPAIADGHATIFRTIYAGSTVRFTVEGARQLRGAPRGPLLPGLDQGARRVGDRRAA
jgi:uncharacterized protein (TIGR02246 family)